MIITGKVLCCCKLSEVQSKLTITYVTWGFVPILQGGTVTG